MVVCKHGCGVEFPDTPQGKASMMRHYRWKCPKNPKVVQRLEQKKARKSKEKVVESLEKVEQKTGYAPLVEREKELSDEDRLDEEQVLDKIIAEASMTRKRPAIVRMVRYVIGKKKESIKALAEALRVADIAPSQRNLIVRNWARHLEIEDVDYILKKDKKTDAEEEEEEGKKKKTPIDRIEEELDQRYEADLKHLRELEVRKRIKDREMELSGEGKKEEEKKLVHIIDGVSLNVTPQEKMAWMRYEDDRKKSEEEREDRKEERKQRESELKTHKEDELIEWVIGEGNSAKTVKVRPETIPLLIQSQHGKNGGSDEVKALRDQFQQFQTGILQKKITELEMQMAIDPFDRLFEHKDKLEKLGLVSSAKASATDRMYSMEGKKLDTMLGIATDTTKSFKERVDVLIDILRPLGADYVKNAIKQQRGPGETVQFSEEQLEAEAKVLVKRMAEVGETMTEPEAKEVIKEEMIKRSAEGGKTMTEMNTETENSPKVVTIEKTKKKIETTEKEGQIIPGK